MPAYSRRNRTRSVLLMPGNDRLTGVHEQPEPTEEEQEQAPDRIPEEEPERDERAADGDQSEEPIQDS